MKRDNHKVLVSKARKIYNERLKDTLEAKSHGQFVAIEADSGDFFLGSTPLEAVNSGKWRHPKKTFHVMKVGYRAAFMLKGGSNGQ